MEKIMEINKDKWISIDLSIGVTRQCNFKCRHCLRGEDENISFDPKLLDRFFKNNRILKHIDNLTLTGGEPLLKPKLLNEILDVFIDNEVYIDMAYIATNGSVFTQESLDFIFRLSDYIDEELFVEISNSEYHQEEAKRLNLYIPDSLENINELYEMKETTYDISRLTLVKENNSYSQLIYQGRASKDIPLKDLENKITKSPKPISNLEYDELFLYLTETGKVLPRYCDYSYESIDSMNLTNIENFNIKEYIEKMTHI
jgi:organic radical activating enzyme